MRPSPSSDRALSAGAALLARVRAAPHGALALGVLALGVLAVAAYLCLVNLDYAALWHDEAPAALIGRNLLQRGDITGWDGRNLVGGTNGRTLNAELRDVLPPLTYVLNAAGMAVFGVNETGARIVPALLGILSLGLLYLLLRQHLGQQPRLILFCLLFAAWSPQLLLYFRQSRYFAFMALSVIAAFYLYERWWRSGGAGWLVALTLVALLAFFNHYSGGAAAMLALAAWHLIFRARATAPRQWLALAAGGAVVVALGTAYLVWVGVIGGERSGFLAFTGVTDIVEYRGPRPWLLHRVLLRVGVYARDLLATDWVSWPVLLWFVGLPLFLRLRHRRSVQPAQPDRRPGAGRRRQRPAAAHRGRGERRPAAAPASPEASRPQEVPGAALPLAAGGRVVLMGALFALFASALSVQPVWMLTVLYADLRYYMGALPLLLAMKGLFVEWAWRHSRIAGAAAGAVLLCSSAGAWPFNVANVLTGERTLGLHLFQFVREIHRPYHDSIRAASDYLLRHAAQDDLVFVPGFADREALTFASGHRVLFCCVLDRNSPLPPAVVESLGPHLVQEGTSPDWIVLFGELEEEYWARIRDQYAVAAQPDIFFYPTQRPEINLHAFAPRPAGKSGVHILRRRAEQQVQQAAAALLRQQRFEEALAKYREALSINPDYAPAHAGMGEALVRLGRYEEALRALERALAVGPSDWALTGVLQRLMGQAAAELGRPEAATGHFEGALQFDPYDEEALDRLALVRFRQQRYEAALELYERLLEVIPEAAQAHANRGATLYHLGRIEEAVRSLEHALSLDPALESARAALEGIRNTLRQSGS